MSKNKLVSIVFELTMPNVGSWNGRWTGEKEKYTVLKRIEYRDLTESFREILNDKVKSKSYYYNFGDGWGASVNVRLKKKGEKVTDKFYGYEWMIDSIIKNDKIIIEKRG